jgi:glycosyltransferase involved in cell wall biosynthesis
VRVVVDTAVFRRPHTGTARWVSGLLGALGEVPTLDVKAAGGPRRVGSGLLFRPVNMTLQRWWYEFGIGRAARRWGADVLLMPTGYAARHGPIPQVVAILDVNYLTEPGTYEPLFIKYATWAMGRAAREAERLVTISAFSRSEISRHLNVEPDRIRVVYPGLNPPRQGQFPRPLEGPYALYVGATDSNKNLGLLLDAWSGSSPAGLPLVIVGQPGRDHATLEHRADQMGGRVILRGRVEDHELEAWYRGAAVFLFPSRAEGFGYPPLEAMQRSVPVISSNRGSLPEVLGDAALYHDPDDVVGVRQLVERLDGDAGLRQRQLALGLAQAARYRWDVTAAHMVEVITSAVLARGV